MKTDNYIPDKGHIVWLDFDPSLGSEQKGRRPSLIVTPKAYNSFGLCYALPITSVIKGYAIEVSVGTLKFTKGVVLTNQLLAIDWRERNTKFIEHIDPASLVLVKSRLRTILGF